MARTPAAPAGELGAWLRFLREQSGLSQTELAATVGTDRRNIRRWEVEGHDPGGSMLMQILSALGVEVTPPPPAEMPRAVNAELREVDRRLRETEDRAARRHDELVARLAAQEAELRALELARPYSPYCSAPLEHRIVASVAALLSAENVTRRFGGVVALDEVSLHVEQGQIAGLIGPNGAGKTTAFNVITRLYKPDSGSVTFDGRDLLRLHPYRIAKVGISRTFQNVVLFANLSVLDNVLVGAHARHTYFQERAARRDAHEALEYVGLEALAERPAAGLPYGTLKRIELARALALRPRLLLLDEPAGGLNHEEVGELGATIRRIRDDFDLTILLVEHHVNLVMSIVDWVYVLNFGEKIADGPPSEVRTNPKVIEAYLGTRHAAA